MAKKMYSFKFEEDEIFYMNGLAARIGAVHNGKPNRAAAIRYALEFVKRNDPNEPDGKKKKSKKSLV